MKNKIRFSFQVEKSHSQREHIGLPHTHTANYPCRLYFTLFKDPALKNTTEIAYKWKLTAAFQHVTKKENIIVTFYDILLLLLLNFNQRVCGKDNFKIN